MKKIIFYTQLKQLGGGTTAKDFYKYKSNIEFFNVEVQIVADMNPNGMIIDINNKLYSVKFAVLDFVDNTYHCLVNTY